MTAIGWNFLLLSFSMKGLEESKHENELVNTWPLLDVYITGASTLITSAFVLVHFQKPVSLHRHKSVPKLSTVFRPSSGITGTPFRLFREDPSL